MCAHRSWAHLAPDSLSNDAHIHHEVIPNTRITNTPGKQLVMNFNQLDY